MNSFARPFIRLIRHLSETNTLFLRLSDRRLSVHSSSSTDTRKQGDSKQQQQEPNQYEYLLVDIKGQNSNVALVQLNRPKKFNFLNDALTKELAKALESLDNDDRIGCIVLTGGRRAFAAGADIKEIQNQTLPQILTGNLIEQLTALSKVKKPTIAAVNGFALGGGCELSMISDIIYAGDKAEFGQSEIIIGTIPGAGATQRLPRSIGKSKAMEMILTGKRISAHEAERIGLINAVYPADEVVDEAIKTAEKIANRSRIVTQLAKEAVNAAFETTLAEGIRLEKCLSRITCGLADYKEGMTAFVEKRQPNFTNQ